MSMRRWAAAVIVALALGLGPSATRAGDGPSGGDVDAFEKGMTRVACLYERGRAEAALKALQALLEEHVGQPYARGRRAEIEDLAQRLSFRAGAVLPEPKTLVSGKLLKWDARSGKIKIEYTPKTRADLERSKDGVWYFPMDLRGPTTIEIEGSSYPMKTDDSPVIYLGGGHNEKKSVEQSFMIIFGTPPYGEGTNEVWMPARILRYDGEKRVPLCKKDISPAKRGKPYKLKLKISKTSLQASINNKSIGKAKKSRDIWGYLGFECMGWEQVTISGEVESSWIQSKIDVALAEQRETFDQSYDRSKVLPDWLFEAGTAPAAKAGDEPADDLPERLAQAHWPKLKQAYDAIEAEDYARVLEVAAKMRKDGAPESICAYLEALAKDELGLLGEALACVDRCLKAAPCFADGLLLRASLLRRLGRTAESAQAFHAGIAAGSKRTYAYELAALTMMFAGKLKEARGFVRLAARNGLLSERLDLLGGALVKAEKGPTWARTYEHKSTNYHVLSDIDKKTCIQASKILEEAFTSYRVHIGWVSRDRSRLFKVYLFGGQTGFLKYQEDLQQPMGSPAEHAAGLYSPLLKQLLIWNLPSRDEMHATIRHEGFHQYLDRFLPDPPTWFNEGLAVYHEDAEKKAGHLVFGQIQREYVKLLKEKGLVPLEEFLVQSNRKFYEPGQLSYAQAWAFIHMLRHGSAAHKKLFKQLVKQLQSDDPSGEVIARVLPETLLDSLDRDLAAYVETLAR